MVAKNLGEKIGLLGRKEGATREVTYISKYKIVKRISATREKPRGLVPWYKATEKEKAC